MRERALGLGIRGARRRPVSVSSPVCSAEAEGDVAPQASGGALPTAVADRMRADAGSWFPEFDGRRMEPVVVATSLRPRSAVLHVALDDGRHRRETIVKIRLHDSPRRRLPERDDRPVLAPERTVSPAAAAQREFDGLRAIETAFRDADPARFGTVRALAIVPESAAVVMERRSEPTLRVVLSAQSRLRLRLRLRDEARRPDVNPWRNAGAWLRLFHGAPLAYPLEARLTGRDDLLARLTDQAAFLDRAGSGHPAVHRLAAAATHRLENELPKQLPSAPGHGDFVAQNVFMGGGGRVTGFDPMPLWHVPVYEDIARFTIGIRLLNEQSASLGVAFPRARLDAYERAFLDGYFGAGEAPMATVRAFQALALLDRWGAMTNKRCRSSRPDRRAVHSMRVRTGRRHYGTEARRLAALLG